MECILWLSFNRCSHCVCYHLHMATPLGMYLSNKKIKNMRRKHIHFNPQHIKSRNCSYLQDLAPLRVAVHVLTGMKHAQCHTVQQDHQHGRSLEPRGGQRLRNTTGNRRQQLACQWHEPGGYSNNKHILLQLLSSDLIIPFKCMNSPDTAVHVCLFRYHFTITKCLQEEKGATEESGSLQGLTCGKKKGHFSLTILFTKDPFARRVGKRSAC